MRRVILGILSPALFGAALTRPSAADVPTYVGGEPDTSYLAGETEPPQLGITLDQALRLAAANSPVSRSALAALTSARGARMREAGVFDPVVFGGGDRTSQDVPVTSPFAGSETRTRSLSGGLSWLSPIGTSIAVGLSQVTFETNAPFTTLPRERRARARAEFVQPLWRGFGLAATRGELRAADRELEAARRSYEAATLDLNALVETAYWELYAAERTLRVQRLQRQRAALFLRDQILRGRAGVVGPGATAIARTFLADQEVLLIDVRIRAGNAADRLAEAMGIQPEASGRLHCLDEPPDPAGVMPLEALLERALAINPGLEAARQDSAAARARLMQAARYAWPSLEAFGGYGGSGLAGTGREIVFGADTVGASFDTGFGEAWDQVQNGDYPDWNFGLRLRLPIGWRSDRGEHERQRGNFERAVETLRARRLALVTNLRRAHRESELAQQALTAMRALVEAAAEQVRIARLDYQAGRTTAYELVNLEADQARSQFRESEALARVARAASELRRLTTSVTEGTPR